MSTESRPELEDVPAVSDDAVIDDVNTNPEQQRLADAPDPLKVLEVPSQPLHTIVEAPAELAPAPLAAAPPPAPLADGPVPAPFSSSPSSTGVSSAGKAGPPADAIGLGAFGKYNLLRSIGAGGMAQIYEGEITGPSGFSKKVVVKTILPEYATLADFKNMFINEAKVAALLNHPNIVQTFDFGEINNRLFISMEFVDGASLQQVLHRATKDGRMLGPRFATAIGLAMCEALSYVARLTTPDGELLGIVHRDITPGNILVSRQGVVKLTDFGVVKSSMNALATQAGTVKGKYGYMSPEQLLGQPVDHRSDIFSLGIVLYEVATQRRLFKRPTLPETVTAVSRAEVRPPSTFIPDFPQGLERLLMRMLALDPAARPQTAHDVLLELDHFRQLKGWTTGGRELAGLLESLFPSGFPVKTELGSSSQVRENTVPGMEAVRPQETGLSWPILVGIAGGLILLLTLIWALVLA